MALRTVRMDGHTHSAFGRLEVVETGRRRRWSEDEKVRIVLESLAGPRLVSATARRHGISRSQLLAWRRGLGAERSVEPTARFVPAMIGPEPPSTATAKMASSCANPGEDRIEIVLARGRRVIVGAGVDAAALARVLDVLERR
ncbi:MAG: transposase family protein [Microvirga sp.]|nr:transposase family protein [Microvirga sp.]